MSEAREPHSTVYIAYAHDDAAVAHTLAEALRRRGFVAMHDRQHIEPGDRWVDRLRTEYAAVDYVVLLLSARFLAGLWSDTTEIESLRQAMRVMGSAFIAAALDDSALKSDLKPLLCWDLRRASMNRCDAIATRFESVAALHLPTLSARKFERLVLRLFEERGFESIDTSGQPGQWWDFFLHRRHAGARGTAGSEKLFVECKYYAHDRPGIRQLSDLRDQVKLLPPDCKALLATNVRLTSAARDWLSRVNEEDEEMPRLEVLDGPKLTRILLSEATMPGGLTDSDDGADQ